MINITTDMQLLWAVSIAMPLITLLVVLVLIMKELRAKRIESVKLILADKANHLESSSATNAADIGMVSVIAMSVVFIISLFFVATSKRGAETRLIRAQLNNMKIEVKNEISEEYSELVQRNLTTILKQGDEESNNGDDIN